MTYLNPKFAAPAMLLSLVVCLQSAPAVAQDNRIASREYAENSVVDFVGHTGLQSTIEFGVDERIENIALGESGDWQVTPNRKANLIFLKPVSAKAAPTNMTVVTNQHTYLFYLKTAAKAPPIFLLRFTYPAEAAPLEELLPEPEMNLASVQETLPVQQLNFGWTMKGADKLFPERSFDDGQSVYLAWSKDRELPAILALGPDGKTEGPVNYTASGEYLVIEGFHNHLILRSGKKSAVLQTNRTPPADARMAALKE